jgi:hypothetical protein
MKNFNKLVFAAILCCASLFANAQGIGDNRPVSVPIPTRAVDSVAFIYGHYGTVDQFFHTQGKPFTEETIDGKKVLYFEEWDWLEIYFGEQTEQDGRTDYFPETMTFVDASGMTHIHFDIWQPYWGTSDLTTLRPYFRTVPWAEAAYQPNGGLITNIAQGDDGWMSIDASLFDFSAKAIFEKVGGFTLGNLFNGDKLAIGNIYFYNDGSSPGVGKTEQAQPETAPVTPSYPAGDVVSLYSNAYTSANPATHLNNSAATWEEKQIAGNDVVCLKNFAAASLTFDCWSEATPVVATGMKYLHFDIWTSEDCKGITVWAKTGGTWSDAGANILKGGAETLLTGQAWHSINIPITVFTEGNLEYNPIELPNGLWGGGFDPSNVASVQFGNGPGIDVYIDNVLFFKGEPSAITNIATEGINVFFNPATDFINITSGQKIANVNVSNLFGQTVKNVAVNKADTQINFSAEASGIYLVTLQLADGNRLTKKILKK